jgi:3-dehydroquinate synthase
MRKVTVNAPGGEYDVLIGHGILELAGESCRDNASGSVAMLVTDSHVGPLYARRVQDSLERSGYEVAIDEIPAGEPSKNLALWGEGLSLAAECGLSRKDLFVALGGGVVGDIAGFMAACYMRGVNVVQVPTSLLAMVDSSVGGKTAIDIPAGKNLVGAFWQPKAVVCDLDCLATLDEALFRDSLGEVLKYGVMWDAALFADLEAAPLSHRDWDTERLEAIVASCVEIKRDVVEKDERESGLRQILNLGHTIGHAVEAAAGYTLGHGTCVAIGMCYMARACAKKGWCEPETARRIEALVVAHGLPTTSSFDADTLFSFALRDKKRVGAYVNIVAVKAVGEVEVMHVTLEEFKELIELGA